MKKTRLGILVHSLAAVILVTSVGVCLIPAHPNTLSGMTSRLQAPPSELAAPPAQPGNVTLRWISQNYPGTQLAITEYGWGGEKDASGDSSTGRDTGHLWPGRSRPGRVLVLSLSQQPGRSSLSPLSQLRRPGERLRGSLSTDLLQRSADRRVRGPSFGEPRSRRDPDQRVAVRDGEGQASFAHGS